MENLSEPFIKRPVMTSLIMATVILFGILAYFNMPVSDLPNIQYPTIEVTTDYPGAVPETIANTVTSPLERQFSTIDDVQTISSTSSNGQSSVVLMFGLNKSLNAAATDVQSAINRASTYLPKDLPNNPVYRKVNPAQTPVLVYVLSSETFTKGEIFDYGFALFNNRLSMVDGVSEVQMYGSPRAVRIQLNPDQLSSRDLTLEEVAKAVQEGNPDMATGTLYGPYQEHTINVEGQIMKASGYENLVIRNHKGALVKLNELGRAIDSLENDKYSLNFYKNDYEAPAVVLAVKSQAGSNTVQVISEIKKLLPELEKDLPPSIHLDVMFDQSLWIFQSVADVEFTLLIAFLLVALVTLFYLGKPADTIIPIIALPVTVLGTFIVMYLLGFSIDILSLLSITLAIGFLIDDAIVVLENIARHVEQGKTRMQAALDGSKQISFTVLSMTSSLIAVFIPMLFMGGMIGRIFREFAATIIIAVSMSGIVALTLTPLLCSRFITLRKEKHKNWIERLSEKINNFMLSMYERGLVVILRHKSLAIIGGLLSLVATYMLFTTIPKDFLPPDDMGFILGFSQAEDGTSPYSMMDMQKKIAEITQDNSNVEMIVSIGALPYDNQSIFYVHLKPLDERQPMQEVIKELYKSMQDLVGVNVFMRSFPLINLDIGTQANKGNYQYTLQSFNQEELYKYARAFIEKMQGNANFKHVTSDMHLNQPQVNILIDRDKASSYDVTAQSIESALGLAYGGTRITRINAPINQYDVRMETLPSAYKDPTMLNKLYVEDTHNNLVPLSQVTKWEETQGPLIINHINTMPSVLISFDVAEHVPLSDALTALDSLATSTLPPVVSHKLEGSAKAFEATFKNLIFLIFIAIFVIYVILGILYENFIHPITVMSVLPPAALSGLFCLLIFNETISLYSFVGLMMLVGIVLKNGIIMVDFANEAIRNGEEDPEAAMKHAALTRFRPIIMTTFSTLMGALPIALGIGGLTASSRQPVGIVIVGGLIFSQILTLFLTPVVFIYLERMRRFFHRLGTKHAEIE